MLVERIIQRITDKKHPVDIDRLLVVTFTKAAAAEMREAAEAVLHEVRSEISNAYLMARNELQLARLAGRTKEQALEGMPTRTQKVIEAMGGIDAFMPPDKKYFEMERFEQTYETMLRKNPIGLPGSTAGQRQITE